MAAASLLRSVATKMKIAHAPPPPPYHRLVHGRGPHNPTSPDPSPSTPKKVLDIISSALDMVSKAAVGVGCIALLSSAIYLHYWVNPELEELRATLQDLRKKRNMGASSVSHHTRTTPPSAGHGNKTQKVMHSQENHVKELQAEIISRTIADLKAEIAELEIAKKKAIDTSDRSPY